jgi:hypothetical protein
MTAKELFSGSFFLEEMLACLIETMLRWAFIFNCDCTENLIDSTLISKRNSIQ